MKTDKKQMNEQKINLGFVPRNLFLMAQFAMLAKRAEDYHKKNKMKMKTAGMTLALIFTLVIGFNAQAQEEKTQQTKTRPFQMTFVTPLGTNGLDAWNITNKVSINLYAGYNGGVDGIEVSGFGSMLKNDMVGTQIAGFGNMIMGNGNGVQLAGFLNYANNTYKGTQLSGFANVTIDSLNGSQVAGFANVAGSKIQKIQLAGTANYSKGNDAGQISGFANINAGDLHGIQLAGCANINTEKVKGVQVSGFVNYTKTLSGVQLAPFNYVDSLEKGLPIGVFSIVKNGYKTIEISANETLYGVVSFKTGVKRFYNIISVGSSIHHNKTYWGWGYGIGTMMPIKNDWNVAIELLSYHINEDEWFTEALNMNNKLQITASKKVSEKTELFGGISWNVNVSELEDHDGNAFESTFTPYDTFNETYDNETNVKMYPGLTAGIRF
ncbi:MAG: hypothetical protein KQH79_17705 [Bacteroidetes bacterium]|nr:hypothetical protein [Bacteroidota bacterium]